MLDSDTKHEYHTKQQLTLYVCWFTLCTINKSQEGRLFHAELYPSFQKCNFVASVSFISVVFRRRVNFVALSKGLLATL
jgi:hypothetical protein